MGLRFGKVLTAKEGTPVAHQSGDTKLNQHTQGTSCLCLSRTPADDAEIVFRSPTHSRQVPSTSSEATVSSRKHTQPCKSSRARPARCMLPSRLRLSVMKRPSASYAWMTAMPCRVSDTWASTRDVEEPYMLLMAALARM